MMGCTQRSIVRGVQGGNPKSPAPAARLNQKALTDTGGLFLGRHRWQGVSWPTSYPIRHSRRTTPSSNAAHKRSKAPTSRDRCQRICLTHDLSTRRQISFASFAVRREDPEHERLRLVVPGLIRGSESAGPIFTALASTTHCEDLWTLNLGPSFRLFAVHCVVVRCSPSQSASREHASCSKADQQQADHIRVDRRIYVRGRWQRGRCSGEVEFGKLNEAVALAGQGLGFHAFQNAAHLHLLRSVLDPASAAAERQVQIANCGKPGPPRPTGSTSTSYQLHCAANTPLRRSLETTSHPSMHGNSNFLPTHVGWP